MRNPWMSAWLSAANRMSGPARGQMMADLGWSQRQVMRAWQKAWADAWMGVWFPKAGKR